MPVSYISGTYSVGPIKDNLVYQGIYIYVYVDMYVYIPFCRQLAMCLAMPSIVFKYLT